MPVSQREAWERFSEAQIWLQEGSGAPPTDCPNLPPVSVLWALPDTPSLKNDMNKNLKMY